MISSPVSSFAAACGLLLTLPLSAAAQQRPTGTDDQYWDSRFTVPGRVTGKVNAVAEAANGDILIGGSFSNAGDNPDADRIARWDGTAWQAVGTGLNGDVQALTFAANGDLLVAGSFTDAGGNPNADRVARWDGTSWQPLSTGLNATGQVLSVAANGDVVVGGFFTDAGGNTAADRIARWDGTAWQAFGAGLNASVYALTRTAGGELLAGGYFTNADGNPNADRVARWDGTAWQPLGTGINDGAVYALAVMPNGDVLAGGSFTTAGGLLAESIARWNGTAWEGFNDGASGPGVGLNQSVNALVPLPNGDLLLGGTFVVYDDIANQATPSGYNLVRWNGTSWQPLGVNESVPAVLALAVAANGDLLAGGDFHSLGGTMYADYVARWHGYTWHPLVENNGSGLVDAPTSIAVAPNGDLLIVVREYDPIIDADKSYVWRWNGSTWTRLGTGFIELGYQGAQTTLTVTPTGTIIVGCSYSGFGIANASLMVYWDGTSWQPMANGLASGLANDSWCTTLSIAANGDVLGGFATDDGDFTHALVARWNGTTWTYVDGADFDNTIDARMWRVNALAEAPNGALLVGGEPGGNSQTLGTSSVLRWDGTDWQELSSPITGIVYALTPTPASSFIVGGDFLDAGGNAAADRITRWDGSTWQPIGGGLNNAVLTLAVTTGGDILAGGNFLDAGGNAAADRIARWDGTAWQPLGTGLNNTVTSLTVLPDVDVAAVGSFTAVGDGSKVTVHVGIYDLVTTPGPASLTITTPQHVPAGTYQNITVENGGWALLDGNVTVQGAVLVKAGGRFSTYGFVVDGAGSFTVAARADLRTENPAGLGSGGATGAVQVTGTRTYSSHAEYTFDSPIAPQVTGPLLPARVWRLTHFADQPLTLSQPVAVRYAVYWGGNGNLLNGQFLTLLSNADTTAWVHNLDGGAVQGAVTVQRYLAPGATTALGYHQLSAPVSTTTVADLTVAGQFTPVVNQAYNSAANPAGVRPYPNVFGYDEARGGPTAPFGTGYFSPAALGSPLVSGRSYSVAMRPATLDFVGTLGNGSVPLTLSRTGNNGKSGWQLLGNPYPEPIDWDLVSVPPGMSSTIYVWKTTGGANGAYRVRQSNGNGTGTGNLTDGLLPMGQGFFALVTGPGPVGFSFENAYRVENFANPPLYRGAASATPALHLTLGAPGASTAAADDTWVLTDEAATLTAADRSDAPAPARNAGLPTLRTLAPDGQELMINTLPPKALTDGLTVELLLEIPVAGVYALTAERLTVPTSAELLDRLTGTRYDLAAQPAVTFTAAQAGEMRGRFALVFGQRTLSIAEGSVTNQLFSLMPNPACGTVHLSSVAAGTVSLLDATNQTVRTWRLASTAADLSLTGLAPGVYVVRVGTATQRLLVE